MLIVCEIAGALFDYEAGICGEDMEGIIGMVFNYANRILRVSDSFTVNCNCFL